MVDEVVLRCPVPGECEHKAFVGATHAEALAEVREHIKRNLEDPNHSEIADMEEWGI